MSFIAGGALAIIFSPVNVVPFAMFFGLQVILMYVSKRWLKNKWFICIPLKVVVLEVGIFGIFKLYGISYIENVFNNFGWNYSYWYVLLITIPFVIAYDYFMQYGLKFLSRRLNGIVSKYTDKVKVVEKKQNNNTQNSLDSSRQNNTSTNDNTDAGDDPFGEF